MSNSTMIGQRRTGAGFMIGTTTDAIHAHSAVDAIPNSRRESVRITAAGHAEDLHADLSERRRRETIAARVGAS